MSPTRLYLGALVWMLGMVTVMSAVGWFRVALPAAVLTVCWAVWIVGDLLMTELLRSPDGRYAGTDR